MRRVLRGWRRAPSQTGRRGNPRICLALPRNARPRGPGGHPGEGFRWETWQGKRLPTEAEFEYAERGRLDSKRYAWGDEFMPHGKYMANTFQGHFPDTNTGADGYVGTAPVKSFPPNGYGLFDMSGNRLGMASD